MYPLFETIKVADGKLCNLAWHQKRLAGSYRAYYNMDTFPILKDCIRLPGSIESGVYKCQFRYNASQYEITFDRYIPREINSLKLVIANDISYPLKYSDREELDLLLTRKGACDDILIIKNGLITDTSFSNVAFYDGSGWYTPLHPLLRGTCMERLISEGQLKEEEIRSGDMDRFRRCRLINAMLEFDPSNDLEIEALVYE